jgi:thioredoxin-related protein
LGWTGTYAVGQRIDTPDIYSGSRFTIILFARSSCGACQAAKPQLRAIANLASTYLGVQMIVVPASDWSPEEGAYIHDLGLREEAVRHLSVSELKVRMVPTLVVVDQRGRIQLVQEGAPTSKEEIAIRNLVRGSNH